VNNPLDVKENDEHALNFAFHLSRLFRSQWIWTRNSNTHVRLILSSPWACLIIARASPSHFFLR
jgi:hypothetical protein